MTISSTVRTAGPFTGNNVTSAFPFAFKVFYPTELIVVQTDLSNVDTTLVYGTDYGVTLNADQNASPGGTITYKSAGITTALPTGYVVNATSNLQDLQPVNITNNGGFFPAVINNALDRLTILVQQLARGVSNVLQFPLSDGGSVSGYLPGKVTRANKVLAFDSSGAPVQSNLTLAQLEDQPAGAAASATAAAASATLAQGWAVTTGALVAATDYSAKEYAIGTTVPAGSAKFHATAAAASDVSAAASAAVASAAASGIKYKASARAATTGNITLSGAQTIDGVSVVAGDRVLVKAQSSSPANGIYTAAAGAWARATDADTWAEIVSMAVPIEEGTLNADRVFICTSNSGGTIGVSSMVFADWSAAVLDGTITNAKLASMAAATLKGSVAGGVPTDLTAAQALGVLGAYSFALTPFTASGTFTTPANATASTIYQYLIVGGGGGGGGSNGAASGAGGGGAGEFAWGSFTGIAASTGVTVTIGAAGTGGSAAGGNGGNGGDSSIGSPVSIVAAGGSGGTGSTSGSGSGGTGGTGGSGTASIRVAGGRGGNGMGSTGALIGGAGGVTIFGGAGTGGTNDNGNLGVPTGYGAGGGASAGPTAAATAGKAGFVLIMRMTP